MIVQGNFNKATIMTEDAELYAQEQLKMICNQECIKYRNYNIVAMPDIHPGKIGPVGLTMMTKHDSINEVIMPGLIGPDIGCGVAVFEVNCKCKDLDFNKLDKVIREHIPYGSSHYDAKKSCQIDNELFARFWYMGDGEYTLKLIKENMGTLGGGNHFIEVDKDSSNNIYLCIHTGSRNLGYKTYDKFMREARCPEHIPYELRYIKDDQVGLYYHAVQACMAFARMNRMTIAKTIAHRMKWDCNPIIDSFHNYISVENINGESLFILRKGACSALAGESVVIPINMRDGIIIGKGKGNPNWNYSAPHGSGRIMNRIDVVSNHTVSEFKKTMKGIHSTCINAGTLDEAPFAYRELSTILPNIYPTVEVIKIIKPIYNFKGGNE